MNHDFITKEMDRLLEVVNHGLKWSGKEIPHVSKHYSYRDGFHERVMWTAGFWPGILWLTFAHTGDDRIAAKAREYEVTLSEFLNRTGSDSGHDLGFQFLLSSCADYRFTGKDKARQIGLKAAKHLSERYNEHGKFIRAWGSLGTTAHEGKIIIDCMLNLPLLFWASQEAGDSRFAEIANHHAATSLARLVRTDATIYHTYDFDPTTGKPLAPGTHQGHSTDSTWARGQAWAVYGFALAYKHTGVKDYLEAAENAADAYWRLSKGELIPPWDFDRPQGIDTVKDSSAAAIVSCGMLELAELCGSEHKKEDYRGTAFRVLEALAFGYACVLTCGEEGFLKDGCYHYPANKGLVECTSWGDYFYMEALLKAKKGLSIY
jgi:unsaturated chondroitin disaccharide hydrolase